MKKRMAVLVTLIVVFCCLFSGCGGSGGSAATGAAAESGTEAGAVKEENGAFSVEGGWKAGGEVGNTFLLFDADGTGVTLSEIQYQGNVPNTNLPSHAKAEFTWKEDAETVTLTADSGISGNSPFTLAGSEATFVVEFNLTNVTDVVSIKLETTDTANGRFVVWGVTAE